MGKIDDAINSGRIKIAVIDRGVDWRHSRLVDCHITGVTLHKDDRGITFEDGFFDDSTGHGTAIAGIIHKNAPDVDIVAVKLRGKHDSIDEELLNRAINWCLENSGIRLINVSIGISGRDTSSELVHLCIEASKKNVAIIGAVHNDPNIECYPGGFSNVYGVSSGFVKNRTSYRYLGNGHVNVLAKGTTQRVASLNNGYEIVSGTSYATAHFTGILGKIISENRDFDLLKLKEHIVSKSDEGIKPVYFFSRFTGSSVPEVTRSESFKDDEALFSSFKKLSFADRVAIYPASEKEMMTILKFRDDCPFTIVQLIDFPRSLHNKNNSSLKDMDVIRRKLIPEEYDSFDSLLLGYFLDQMSDVNVAIGENLIENGLLRGKNFITWDKHVYQLIIEKKDKIAPLYTGTILHIRINVELYRRVLNFASLPKVSVPILAVVGTGSKQGKITTQLRLKSILRNAGYKVAHISTEPQGLVLGADFVFPYGHKSDVHIKQEVWSKFLDIVVRGVEKYNNPDIIITGTQSFTIPQSITLAVTPGTAFSTLCYLSGVRPDVIICTISPNDSIEYIQQTIQTIQVFCGAIKVLFYAMCPLVGEGKNIGSYTMLSESELHIKIKEFSMELSRPVLNVMCEENNQIILNAVQNGLS